MVFDPAEDSRVVAFADLRDHHTHGKAASRAEAPRQKVGTITHFLGGCEDTFLGLLRDGVGDRRTIHHQRNRSGGQTEIIRYIFEGNGLLWTVRALADICTRFRACHSGMSVAQKWPFSKRLRLVSQLA